MRAQVSRRRRTTIRRRARGVADPKVRRELTFVGHVLSPNGGQEVVSLELVRALLDRGWQITVIARRCELEHPRLRWVRIRAPERPAALGMLVFSVLGGLATARRSRGIVHVNGTVVPNRADVCTVHFCHRAFKQIRRRYGFRRARRDTLAYRINESISEWIHTFAESALYRPSRRLRLVAVSEGLAGELQAHFPEFKSAVDVIQNGVSLEKFAADPRSRHLVRSQLGIPADAPTAVFVGGDWERKGLRFAIAAVASCPSWHLIVVGDGDNRRYEHVAGRNGADRIHFVGQVATPENYLAASDAFVFPTAYETFSLATYEAAAAGLPLLVPAVSGANELVQDGVNGFVIERDVGVIASRLRQLECDRALLNELGADARRLVEDFAWASMVERYLALYDQLGETSAQGAAA